MSTPRDLTTTDPFNGASATTPDENSHEIPWAAVIIYVLVDIVILFGNTLVIAAVLRFRFLQNPTNMFVAAVACLDLCFASTVTMQIAEIVRPDFMSGRLSCVLDHILGVTNAVANGLLLFGKLSSVNN